MIDTGGKRKVELKVKAATWVTFLFALAGTTLLSTTATDYVPALSDWLEAPAYALLLATGTLLGGYLKRSRPENLSDSTISAVQKWLDSHAPRAPRA